MSNNLTCSYRPPRKNNFSLYFFVLGLVVAVFLLAVACSRQSTQQSTTARENSSTLVSYKDGIGRTVRLPKRPQRIISLAPNVTETIYFLGAQDRLIGDTTVCDWPKEAKSKPKIGDLLNPNYEIILAAKPDLVIASTAGNSENAVKKLTDLGLPVYVVAPRTVESIFQTVEQMGLITDCADQGRQLVETMKARLEKVHARIAGLPPLRAFFITWFDPLLAPGKSTFENDVLRLANAISITADIPQFYPRYSLEQVIVRDPDVILTIEHQGDPLPDFGTTAGWKKLKAVKNGKVFFLSEYLQHPSPLFVDGVEELASKLYPERFK